MTRETAEAIASRIPGAEVRGGAKFRWIRIPASHGFEFDIGSEGAIRLNASGVMLEANKIVSVLADLRMKFNEIESAIAAAVADGFPDPRSKEEGRGD